MTFAPLTWIVLMCLAGMVASIAVSLLASLATHPRIVPVLVSYAIGAMRGAVFLDLLPHAFEHATDLHQIMATVLGGILFFFLLEKLVLWRHCHEHHCEAHEHPVHMHSPRASGWLILIADAVHAYLLFSGTEVWVPFLLAVAASSLIYVSVADLIPGLHKRAEIKATMLQIAMILSGVLSIQVVQWLIGGNHA